MNKAAVSLAALFVLAAAVSWAADTDADIKTNGYLNGRAIIQFMDGDDNGKYFATQFISGALEGMSAINGSRIREIYSGVRREDVIVAVIGYYRNNPAKRYRPVVDVILSGCK